MGGSVAFGAFITSFTVRASGVSIRAMPWNCGFM